MKVGRHPILFVQHAHTNIIFCSFALTSCLTTCYISNNTICCEISWAVMTWYRIESFWCYVELSQLNFLLARFVWNHPSMDRIPSYLYSSNYSEELYILIKQHCIVNCVMLLFVTTLKLWLHIGFVVWHLISKRGFSCVANYWYFINFSFKIWCWNWNIGI